MSLVPAIPEETEDKTLTQAQVLLDYIALNEEDGLTVNELIKHLKGFTRHTEFTYLLLLGKTHLLADNVYPFASFAEDGNVLRVKLVTNPLFKELPEGTRDLLAGDPSATFAYKNPKLRLEYSILGNCLKYIKDSGFEGSIKHVGKNWNLQDILIPFQYKEFFDARPADNLCTEIKLFEDPESIPNVVIEQILSAEGRRVFKASLIASSQSTISEKAKLLDSLDKGDHLATPQESGGTNIQINVLGSSESIKAEVVKIDRD